MSTTMDIKLSINNKPYELTVDVRKPLMDVLRELGYISVKQGCGVGECGACTVLIDGRSVDTCLYLAVWARGKSVRTVEGESRDGKLSVIQEAYAEEGAVQCGRPSSTPSRGLPRNDRWRGRTLGPSGPFSGCVRHLRSAGGNPR